MAQRRQLDLFRKLKLGDLERYGIKGKKRFEAQQAANKTAKKVRAYLAKKSPPKPYVNPNKQLNLFEVTEKVKATFQNADGSIPRQSILGANSKSIAQKRLSKANVPNAFVQFPPIFNLETGNSKEGKGYYKRTAYQGAKLSAKTQAAAAKNVIKRAKIFKRRSVRAVAVAGIGALVVNGIKNKIAANNVPKGYKMVFGKIRRIRVN